jgi:hypothetical protein
MFVFDSPVLKDAGLCRDIVRHALKDMAATVGMYRPSQTCWPARTIARRGDTARL